MGIVAKFCTLVIYFNNTGGKCKLLKIPLGGRWFGKNRSRTLNCSYKFYSFTSDILSNPGQVTALC